MHMQENPQTIKTKNRIHPYDRHKITLKHLCQRPHIHREILPTQLSSFFLFTSKSGKSPWPFYGQSITILYILATLKQNFLFKYC